MNDQVTEILEETRRCVDDAWRDLRVLRRSMAETNKRREGQRPKTGPDPPRAAIAEARPARMPDGSARALILANPIGGGGARMTTLSISIPKNSSGGGRPSACNSA